MQSSFLSRARVLCSLLSRRSHGILFPLSGSLSLSVCIPPHSRAPNRRRKQTGNTPAADRTQMPLARTATANNCFDYYLQSTVIVRLLIMIMIIIIITDVRLPASRFAQRSPLLDGDAARAPPCLSLTASLFIFFLSRSLPPLSAPFFSEIIKYRSIFY